MNPPLNADELRKIHAYWRAANYISAAQLYLLDNPLLKKPLTIKDIKPRLLGHWGTAPGLNFIYVHMNRAIKTHGLNVIFLTGPGHGAPAIIANTYLEGSYTEFYPSITRDEQGLQKLFKQFSFPGGIPSHTASETPGSIHEGGELGYVISHANGAVFDNPDLIACCVIGDGEAETGPLAGSWHANKFLNPVTDGAVLPILHLNQYKIANPTYLARIPQEELETLLRGYGYKPYFVEGSDPEKLHPDMAQTLDVAIGEIKKIQAEARSQKDAMRPLWPMIVLKTPKGWTGPKVVDGKMIENSWRAHQVPIMDFQTHPEHIQQLEQWLKSYRIEELLDEHGTLKKELQELAPKGKQRMGSNVHANGGQLLKELSLPSLKDLEIKVDAPGKTMYETAKALGSYLKEVIKKNPHNFRLFGPDETASNRLGAVFDTTNRAFEGKILATDDHLAHEGRVLEVLSEHLCQGWLEGYLLTGRHGLFSCYEAFIHIVDSMFNQHAKWLKVSRQIPWRKPIASLNYFLTSHVWRQDHNGFSHQDPGFIDHVINKKAEIVRVYLPPDANTLLSVADHCLKSKSCVNVIIAGKHMEPQFLNMDQAIAHCTKGIGVWKWASTDKNQEPDAVLACAGDVPTMEALAAADLLRQHLPALKVRFINVVDLMVLQPDTVHPHGLSDQEFETLFTKDRPVIFAFHGYPTLIHKLTYRRINHENIHVHGYKEEGTTTTPFDMTVLNELDRFHLVMAVVKRIDLEASKKQSILNEMQQKLIHHKQYIQQVGDDLPEVRDWKWPY